MSDHVTRGPYPQRPGGTSVLLLALPFTLVPLIVYNLLAVSSTSIDWIVPALSLPMPSGRTLELGLGDVILVIALVALFLEIIKATRTTTNSIVDHMISMFVFIVALIELLLVPFAGTSTFLLLVLIALFDVLAGFSVTIRAARRDVGFTTAI